MSGDCASIGEVSTASCDRSKAEVVNCVSKYGQFAGSLSQVAANFIVEVYSAWKKALKMPRRQSLKGRQAEPLAQHTRLLSAIRATCGPASAIPSCNNNILQHLKDSIQTRSPGSDCSRALSTPHESLHQQHGTCQMEKLSTWIQGRLRNATTRSRSIEVTPRMKDDTSRH